MPAALSGTEGGGYTAPGPVEISKAERYVGQRMRVTDRDGVRMTGRLIGADAGRIVIEKSLHQGSMEIEMATSEVQSLELLE